MVELGFSVVQEDQWKIRLSIKIGMKIEDFNRETKDLERKLDMFFSEMLEPKMNHEHRKMRL